MITTIKEKIESKVFWGHFIAALAAVASAATLVAFTFNRKNDTTSPLISIASFVLIIIICFFYAMWMTRKKKEISLELNPDLKVTVEFGDLFKKKGIIGIPFNEYFDTIVDNDIIAHSTLNGKFIDKFYRDRREELDRKVSHELHKIKTGVPDPHRFKGNKVKYPLGTCISIREGENVYVLFAFTHFDQNNFAFINPNEVNDVIINLMKYLKGIANGTTVYLPIFGTGLSRLNKTPQRILLYILECIDFMEKITLKGGLHFVCYDQNDYNLNNVEKYFTKNIL